MFTLFQKRYSIGIEEKHAFVTYRPFSNIQVVSTPTLNNVFTLVICLIYPHPMLTPASELPIIINCLSII
jgi:hypothetical protein